MREHSSLYAIAVAVAAALPSAAAAAGSPAASSPTFVQPGGDLGRRDASRQQCPDLILARRQ